ncbi:MAG: YgjV family protein [Oscillospiraceae bacterium]|nr:YgjV family protein [Clostridia bacterium]MBP3209807.1 YgjV family protein [Oscillospiraceae bacterium]
MNSNLIGNLVSFVAACFTIASAWSGNRKRIYLYQAIQCFLLALANIFFISISGVTTYIICAFRNMLLAYERFTARLCNITVACVGIIGVSVNNRGIIGLLPVITTALYTIICFYAKRRSTIKMNIIVNLALWAVYDILIHDYVSFSVDTGSAIVAVISILRNKIASEGENETV